MWKRLDERRLKNASKSGETQEARTYGEDGKSWPRICVVIRSAICFPGFEIDYHLKQGPGEWWVKTALPVEALRELPEMIVNFLKRCVA